MIGERVEIRYLFFFFSSRRRHTRLQGDWSSDVCSSDLVFTPPSGALTLVILADDADGDNITFSFDPADVADLSPTPSGVSPIFTQTVNEIGRASCRERV